MSTRLAVGERFPWPLQADQGMQALIEPAAEWLTLVLIVSMREVTAVERRTLSDAPVTLSVLTSPPLVWIIASAESLAFDAPYCLGLHPPARRVSIAGAASKARRWKDEQRGAVTVVGVELADSKVFMLRTVSVSRDWAAVLADGLNETNSLSVKQTERDMAIMRDYKRWPDAKAMLAAAAVSERAASA